MYPSIFNDVFGPVMIGPSSSGFAGPNRLGLVARDIHGGTPSRLKVSYMPNSGRAAMRVGLGTNMGILAGVLGWGPDDPRVFGAFRRADELGLAADFVVEDIPGNDNPNAMLLELWSEDGRTASLLTESVGGGTIDVIRIGDFPVEGIKGEEYVLVVFHQTGEGFGGKLEKFLEERLAFGREHILSRKEVRSPSDAGRSLTLLHLEEAVADVSAFSELREIKEVRLINPIMPVVTRRNLPPPLFTSAAQMAELAEKEKTDCSEIVIRYEMRRSGLSREEVVAAMGRIWDIMKNTVAVGRKDGVQHGRGPYHHLYAGSYLERMEKGESLLTGIMAEAVGLAICAHEGKSDNNTLTVAGPAAGAPPIMTGTLKSAAVRLGRDDGAIVHALFTAAGLGAVAYMTTVPTGELTGCTGEVGVASAMAAGAVVTLAGGTPGQVVAAASIALMNLFGIPCDPIAGGGCGMPCRGRSTLAPVNSVMCAELALSGFDSVVPYDQVVLAMDMMYKDLPGYMKGSLTNGIPATRAAREVADAFQNWLKTGINS